MDRQAGEGEAMKLKAKARRNTQKRWGHDGRHWRRHQLRTNLFSLDGTIPAENLQQKGEKNKNKKIAEKGD